MNRLILSITLLSVATLGKGNLVNALQLTKQQTEKNIDQPDGRIECTLDPSIVAEIQSYQGVVDSIIDYIVNGVYKGDTHSSLQSFTDFFGPRIVSLNINIAIMVIFFR